MRAVQLKTEYRHFPIGIESSAPLFSWKCEGGIKQTAYQVIARDKVERERLLFDSSKVETDAMCCRYNGEPLQSGQRVVWQVTLWDESNNEGPAETAEYEMGLLNPDDWHACWICGIGTDKRERLPADYYKKTFALPKTVAKARLYATACGVYTAKVNGKRICDVLAPGRTQYDKHLYYQTYDVTDFLSVGENVIEVIVGDGWYKGKLGNDNNEYVYGTQTKAWAQLNVTFTDGTKTVIGTDKSFLWCNDGPIGYNDLKDGEVYDARRIPSYAALAKETTNPIKLSASVNGGITEHERFRPNLLVSPSGARILDFGQNMSGYIRFRANGKPGDVITLKMCETLDHGEYTDSTIRNFMLDSSVSQQITYVCADETDWFQPDFFYSGFRYALVEGMEEIRPSDFEAVAVYSEMDFTGHFSCSSESINQFVHNTIWSEKSNFVDIPTDCPQREKSGWTGDAQVFVKTATYLADTLSFYRKWLKDVHDCQREDGRVDNVCPKISGNDPAEALNGSVGWADAAVIIPYTLWRVYGDNGIIAENYDLMHGWKEYVIAAANDKSIYHLPDGHPLKPLEPMITPFLLSDSPYNRYVIESGLHWGEWCEPDSKMDENPTLELVKPKQEVTAAYMHYSMTLLEEMLRALGKIDEAEQCREYAEGAKAAYNFHFVRQNDMDAAKPAPLVRALALGLLDPEVQTNVALRLNEMVINRQYTVGTGFLSTPFILPVLVRYGYVDTAYKMLENTEAPGWLAMVKQGATTVWENYIGFDEDGHPRKMSMNHYSLGAVCSFLFDTVCGISVTGNNCFNLAPTPGGSLNWAMAEYDSIYGKVVSRWKRNDDGYTFHFEIPANTVAKIQLPNGDHYEVCSGTYQYACT